MRLFKILFLLVVILPLGCYLFRPSLSDIDFLSLDVTIFSITLALITFFAPTILRFKTKAWDVDQLLIKSKLQKAELLDNQADLIEKISESGCKESKDTIVKARAESEKLKKQAANPQLISNDVNNIFSGYHDYMKWCLGAIIIEVIVIECLFTSNVFITFMKDDLACVSSWLNLSDWKTIISSYIKLASLSLQLFFLACISNDMIHVMKTFKYE